MRPPRHPRSLAQVVLVPLGGAVSNTQLALTLYMKPCMAQSIFSFVHSADRLSRQNEQMWLFENAFGEDEPQRSCDPPHASRA